MAEQQFKKGFIFLDTDKHASPFDTLTTIDVFPDATMLKYEDVTVEDAEKHLRRDVSARESALL